MPNEMEYEAKSLLTKTGFAKLKSRFKNQLAVSQQNDYYDTEDFQLKQADAALRVRFKNGNTVLTLKTPVDDGLLETNQCLTEFQLAEFQKGKLPENDVKIAVESLIGKGEKLYCFGSLTTHRIEIIYREGLLCLDHSIYGGTEDFEVEFEGTSMPHAEQVLSELLAELNVKREPAPSKIARFFAQVLAK